MELLWRKKLYSFFLFLMIGFVYAQSDLRVNVLMQPDLYHQDYCCLNPISELNASYEVSIDYQCLSSGDSISYDLCTLKISIDPGSIDSIRWNSSHFSDISEIPGYDAIRSTSTDFYFSVGPLESGIVHSIDFIQSFNDLGPCEDFTTRAEIYLPDSSEHDSGVANVEYFLLPTIEAEIVQTNDISCSQLQTDIIIDYCPHGRDYSISDSIIFHVNFDPHFWRTDSIYFPKFNPDHSWDTLFNGTIQYSFLGISDSCNLFQDTLTFFSTRLPDSPWCEGQHFTVNAQDFINCGSAGHNLMQDILYKETWLEMPLNINHHLRIDRISPDPLDSLIGGSRTVCYEPDRQCICEGDTILISATVEIGEMECRPSGVDLLLHAWPKVGTIFRDIETETLYSGESGFFLTAPYPLDSYQSGDTIRFSRKIYIEQIPSGNNEAIVFGDSIDASGACSGLTANIQSFLPCSLTALAISKTADRHSYSTGDTAIFTIQVANEGGRPFNNVRISDSLSQRAWGGFINIHPTPDVFEGTRIEWNIENMEPDQIEIFTIEMEIFESDSFPQCSRTYDQENYANAIAFSGPNNRDAQTADTVVTIGIEVPCFCFFDLNRNSFSASAGENVTIRIMTRKREEVRFDVYNMAGTMVKSIEPFIVYGGAQWAYSSWDGTDDDGDIVPSGAYYIALRGEYNFEKNDEYRCNYKAINVYNK